MLDWVKVIPRYAGFKNNQLFNLQEQRFYWEKWSSRPVITNIQPSVSSELDKGNKCINQ